MRRGSFIALVLVAAVLAGCIMEGPEKKEGQPQVGASDDPMQRLVDMGYIDNIEIAPEDMGKDNVTGYVEEASYSNLNYFCAGDKSEIMFIDMHGNIVNNPQTGLEGPMILVEPLAEGDYLVVLKGKGLARFDWNGSVSWLTRGRFHHDAAEDEDGSIVALINAGEWHEEIENGTMFNTYLLRITADGEIVSNLSYVEMSLSDPEMMDIIRDRDLRFAMDDGALDVYHTNNVEIVKRDFFRDGKMLFGKGDVLTSMRNLDTIAVIDPQEGKFVWKWGKGELDYQHNPTITEEGTILIFDNGYMRGWSRIIELDPITEEIVWEYTAEPKEDFFSKTRGSVQKLPNGNLLIAESDRGRAFEINREGEIVWEFWNWMRTANGTLRNYFYRLNRLMPTEEGAESGLSACRLIGVAHWRDECVAQVAEESDDMGSCESSATDDGRHLCRIRVAAARGDMSFCDDVPSGLLGECIVKLANATGDASKCERAGDLGDLCLLLVSNHVDSADICEGIFAEGMRDQCIFSQAMRYGRMDDCLMLGGKIRDECLYGVATKIGDIQVCAWIETEDDRDRCLADMAIREKDAGACTTIGDHVQRDRCRVAIGKRLNSTSFCGMVENRGRRDKCMAFVAQTVGDANVCDMIIDRGDRDDCLYELARDLGDWELCGRIREGRLSERCDSKARKNV